MEVTKNIFGKSKLLARGMALSQTFHVSKLRCLTVQLIIVLSSLHMLQAALMFSFIHQTLGLQAGETS